MAVNMRMVLEVSRKSMLKFGFMAFSAATTLFPNQSLAVPVSEAPTAVTEVQDYAEVAVEADVAFVNTEVETVADITPVAAPIVVVASEARSSATDISIVADKAQALRLKSKPNLLSFLQNLNPRSGTRLNAQKAMQSSALSLFTIAPAGTACGIYRPVQNDYIDKSSPCASKSVY
jgi:hypothetical protein